MIPSKRSFLAISAGLLAAALIFAPGQLSAQDVETGGYTFDGENSEPNAFVAENTDDSIVFEPNAVLDADVSFFREEYEKWGQWQDAGADPADIDDFDLKPLSALTLGNSGFDLNMGDGSRIINRARDSEGLLTLGNTDVTTGADTVIHGHWAGVSFGNFDDPEQVFDITLQNSGQIGSWVDASGESSESMDSIFGVLVYHGVEGEITNNEDGVIEGDEFGIVTNYLERDSYFIPLQRYGEDIKTVAGRLVIDNSGEIRGGTYGIYEGGGYEGGDIDGGSNTTIINQESGLIKGGTNGIRLLRGGEIENNGIIEGGDAGIVVESGTAEITNSGTISVTGGQGTDAIRFAQNSEGGTVRLGSSVNDDIRHLGDSSAAALYLEDAGPDASVGNMFFGEGSIVQESGDNQWTVSDIQAREIDIQSGVMESKGEVSADQEINIDDGAKLSVTGGIVRTNDFDNRGTLDFGDGEIRIQGGRFDYSESPANFDLAGDGEGDSPLLRLTNGAETSGINTLTIGETGAGTLKLEDGSRVTADSGLEVEGNGRLEGNGTIAGDVSAGGAGTINPGDPTGTMTVEGDLEVAGTGDEKAVLDILIKAGNNNSGKIHATETALLENAEVSIKDISGGAVTDGTVYTFLSTDDSLDWNNWDDEDFVSRSPLYGFAPFVEADRAGFTARRLTDYSEYARTGNQKNIANALESARKNRELSGITPGWERLLEDIVENRAKSADMRRALDQMSPEPYLAALRSAAGQAFRMTRRTLDGARQSRLTLASKGGADLNTMLQSALASAGTDPVAMGQAMYAAADSGTSSGRSGIDYQKMGTSAADSPWRAFYGAYRRRGDMDEARERAGYELGENGYYLGMERETGRNWVAGANIGYAYTSADFSQGRGSLSMKSLRLGPHATWTGKMFTVDSAISFGAHANRQSRKMTLPEEKEAKARFNIFDGSVYTEARLNRNSEHNWHFIPVASMHYTWQYREAYEERGAGDANLAFEDDTAQSLEGLAGLMVSREYSGPGFVLLPEIYGLWGMELLDSDLDMKAEFENAPGSRFSVTSEGTGRSRGVVGIGISVLFGGYNVAYARYEREFSGAGDLDAYSAGVKWNF